MRAELSRSGTLALCLLLSGLGATAQDRRNHAEVSKPAKHDVSPPLKDIHPPPRKPRPPHANPRRTIPRKTAAAVQRDPVVQTSLAATAATTSGLNLPGLGADFVGPEGGFFVETAPPDPNGAAGVTQYVQIGRASCRERVYVLV